MSQLKPVSEYIPIFDSTLLMLIQGGGGNYEGISLLCCTNLRGITLSLGDGRLTQPCQFVEKCLSAITNTQLSEVGFDLQGDMPYFGTPGAGLPRWDSLDVILHRFSGKYRPRSNEDKMVVELWNPHTAPS